MSKKMMLDALEAQLQDVPPEMFVGLEALGSAAREIWFKNHGLHLDADQRATRNEPLATVGATTITVECHGKRFTLTQADPDKPSVVIPVGLSDKITTSMTNKDWIIGFLYSSLGACFNGDFTHAKNIGDFMNQCLTDAMVEDDEGRTKVDKDLLPTFVHSVEVAEFVESLKRQHRTRSRGTTRINMTVAVEDAQAVPAVDALPHPTIPSPASVIVANEPQVNDAPTGLVSEVIMAAASDVHLTPQMSEKGGAENSDDSAPSDPNHRREQIENALLTVIGYEARTIGFLRKTMEGFDEDDWRPRLEAMLKVGRVTKEGKARACRYKVGGIE